MVRRKRLRLEGMPANRAVYIKGQGRDEVDGKSLKEI
jgi:hypothetical protein